MEVDREEGVSKEKYQSLLNELGVEKAQNALLTSKLQKMEIDHKEEVRILTSKVSHWFMLGSCLAQSLNKRWWKNRMEKYFIEQAFAS